MSTETPTANAYITNCVRALKYARQHCNRTNRVPNNGLAQKRMCNAAAYAALASHLANPGTSESYLAHQLEMRVLEVARVLGTGEYGLAQAAWTELAMWLRYQARQGHSVLRTSETEGVWDYD